MPKLAVLALAPFLFTLSAQAEELRCFAGLQKNLERLEFSEMKSEKDFATSESTAIVSGHSYTARKYTVELDQFVVEGTLFLDSGIAPELTITDKSSGVIARVKQHRVLHVTLSIPRDGKLTHLAASCTHW